MIDFELGDSPRMSDEELRVIGRCLATAEFVLTLLLLAAMTKRGLIGAYKVFFAFMVFAPLGPIAYLVLSKSQYSWFYVARTPIFWVLDILIV